jgi:hypothetical protein
MVGTLPRLRVRMECHCIGVFSDAGSSLYFEAIEEHWVTEDGHPVAPDAGSDFLRKVWHGAFLCPRGTAAISRSVERSDTTGDDDGKGPVSSFQDENPNFTPDPVVSLRSTDRLIALVLSGHRTMQKRFETSWYKIVTCVIWHPNL